MTSTLCTHFFLYVIKKGILTYRSSPFLTINSFLFLFIVSKCITTTNTTLFISIVYLFMSLTLLFEKVYSVILQEDSLLKLVLTLNLHRSIHYKSYFTYGPSSPYSELSSLFCVLPVTPVSRRSFSRTLVRVSRNSCFTRQT